MRLGEVLGAAGVTAALLGRDCRVATMTAGAALMASSALTRFGIFQAGIASSADPQDVVQPQREQPRTSAKTSTS